MTLIALPTILWYPTIPVPMVIGGTPGLRSNLIDGDDEYYGIAFQIPEADDGKSISKIEWRTVAVTTTGDLDVRLETLDGSGNPSGTLATTNSNLVQNVLDTNDNVWFASTLTASHTVAAGDVLCAIIKRQTSGTFVGNLAAHRRGTQGVVFPYEVLNTGSDAKDALELDPPCLAIGYGDGTYLRAPGMYPVDNAAAVTFTSASSNAENGLKFQVPFPCRVIGAYVTGGSSAVGSDFSIHLYDSSGVPQDTDANRLATIAVDGDHNANPSATASTMRAHYFTGPVSLTKDTAYRLTVEATTANDCRLSYFDVDAAGLLQAMPGGANWTWTEDNGAGGWTDTGTRTPMMGLLIDQIDDGSGGGGLSFINQRRNAMIGR